MKIGDFDTEKRVFVIAEAGINHNGNLEWARRLVDAAKDAGADAVKFQTFHVENFPEPQRSICKPYQLTDQQFLNLHEYCQTVGIMFLSTPFDVRAVDFLEPLVPAYKIGSGQATDQLFVDYVLSKKKPTIISTGMMTDEQLYYANFHVQENVKFLHCVSEYPMPPAHANLKRMVKQELYGYSDHSDCIEMPVAAVALGARIIEKHLTLDCKAEGPDHKASIEPIEFKIMVAMIRAVEQAIC